MGKKLVHIHTSPDKMEAELLKGFLEENGVKVLLKPNPGPHGAFLGAFGGSPPFDPWLIYVWEDAVEEAKTLVASFSNESSPSNEPNPSSEKQNIKSPTNLKWIELVIGVMVSAIVIGAMFINVGLAFALAIAISIIIRGILHHRKKRESI